MRLPALEIQQPNVPGIMLAQQQYRLGEVELAKHGREAEKETLMTGLRAGAVGGDRSMLDAIAAIDPAEAKRLVEFAETRDERQKAAFMQDAQLVVRAIADLGENPSPLQIQQTMQDLQSSGVSADNLPFTPEQIAAVTSQPAELDKMKAQLAATAEVLQKRAKGLEAEPRERETRQEGSENVVEEYDPISGTYKEISRGPKFSPTTTVNVESADPTSLLKYMTKQQRGKEIAALRETEVQAVQMVKQGAELIRSLQEGGDQTVSWSGAMVRGADTLVSQGRAIANTFGMDLDTKDWEWGPLATESSEIKSKILGLAVAITKADQGSRPSDFDVQTSIQRIAGAAGNAERTAAVVRSLLDEKMGDFSIQYNTIAPDYELEPFDWDKTLSRHKIDLPEAVDDPLGIR